VRVPSLAERGELLPSARERPRLLDLVTGNDVEAAETLMRHHLRHVRGIWATPPRAGRQVAASTADLSLSPAEMTMSRHLSTDRGGAAIGERLRSPKGWKG
jgi:hypothetical protein